MVETRLESLNELRLKVDSKRERLFTEDHVLKKHAADESEHWNNVLANINEMREKTQKCINQITFVRSHICGKFPVGNTSQLFELQKKRRGKENARKSRQRKRERLIS